MSEREEAVLQQCEDNGLEWAKVFIQGQENSEYGLAVRFWIAARERSESDHREKEKQRLAEAAIAEAKRAADVSRDAAKASHRSARWTMIAAIAAAAGTLLQAIPVFAHFIESISK